MAEKRNTVEQEITPRISSLPWQEICLRWLIWIYFSQLQNGNQDSRWPWVSLIDRASSNPAQAYSQLTLISIVTTCCTLVVSALGLLSTQWSSAKMGDKTQPPTSIVVQTVCTKFFEWPGGTLGEGAVPQSPPIGQGPRIGGSVCRPRASFFESFYQFVWLYLFLQLFFFLFANWWVSLFIFVLVFKVVDWLFTFANLFQVVNFSWDNFSLTTVDLTDWYIF